MQHTCCRSTAQRPLVSESTTARCATTSALTRTDLKSMKLCTQVGYCVIVMPLPWGGALSDTAIRQSVPWRSCLGYGHAGCLQLSYHQPPEMCGLRTQPRTDVDPPRFLPPSNCHRRGRGISSRCPWGDTLLDKLNFYHMMHTYSAVHCCGSICVSVTFSVSHCTSRVIKTATCHLAQTYIISWLLADTRAPFGIS